MPASASSHSSSGTPLHAFFFFSCYGDHRDLHSFPTRRSSDLSGVDPQRGAGQSWEPPDYRDRVLEPDGRIARSERFGVHADSTRYGSDGLASRVATPPVASPGVTEQLAAPVDGADGAPGSPTPDEKPPKPKRVSKWDRPPE